MHMIVLMLAAILDLLHLSHVTPFQESSLNLLQRQRIPDLIAFL
jgi:hypothetical protein